MKKIKVHGHVTKPVGVLRRYLFPSFALISLLEADRIFMIEQADSAMTRSKLHNHLLRQYILVLVAECKGSRSQF